MRAGDINIAEYRKLLDNRVGLGATVKSLLDSQGFLILKAILHNFKNDVKEKESYQTIHEFRADRKALQIIDGLFGELDALVNNAEQAQAEIQKLIETESPTPSLLTLDGEGSDDGRESTQF